MSKSIVPQKVPRCASCGGWLPKVERQRFPRICRSCRRQIHQDWLTDLRAIMAPDWPATTAAAIRASGR